MCAARRSLNQIRLPQALEAIVLRTRMLLDNSVAQVTVARGLRETASNLRQENADFREFLREKCLIGLHLCEQWLDNQATPKTL